MLKNLDKNAVHVFHADIGTNGPINLEHCWAILGEAERARAKRFRYDLHRERYVRAHGQLRQILAHYLGQPDNAVEIETEQGGKPFLTCRDLHFNMSHSADTAVFGISEEGHIGIDVELFDRRVEVDELSAHYYTGAEQETLAALQTQERHEVFFWLWTAKEARMKLTGEGLALDPRKIDVAVEAGRPHSYRMPTEPAAHLAAVDLDGLAGACTVAGLREIYCDVKSIEDLPVRF
ncbi:MAG: hypothetical protein COB93_06680 [Sneathiella sp.]|nr:MAG: hypothetical protein COB93_06680 [Sneathiella sp.]